LSGIGFLKNLPLAFCVEIMQTGSKSIWNHIFLFYAFYEDTKGKEL